MQKNTCLIKWMNYTDFTVKYIEICRYSQLTFYLKDHIHLFLESRK